MSPEYLALMALRTPAMPSKGDMWWNKRLGIIRVFTGHKRGTKRGQWPTDFSLYHFGKPSLYSHPCDWREDDANATLFYPNQCGDERWIYIGSLFDRLPYTQITRCPPQRFT